MLPKPHTADADLLPQGAALCHMGAVRCQPSDTLVLVPTASLFTEPLKTCFTVPQMG
jgi:hypothetical protein